jgi:hypothetical protein
MRQNPKTQKHKFVFLYKITKKQKWKYFCFVTSEAINFEPIKIQTHWAPQNDHLNLSFVKDEDTYGKKMARNGLLTVIKE